MTYPFTDSPLRYESRYGELTSDLWYEEQQ